MSNLYKLLMPFLLLISIVALLWFGFFRSESSGNDLVQSENEFQQTPESDSLEKDSRISSESLDQKSKPHPMSIEILRKKEYPGGNFVIEEKLPNGANYAQSIVSYRSEGLKIFGLLTIPKVQAPENGFPAVVFVHGYIPPSQYSTTGNYPTYQATLAKSGVVTFKPDLRGHGKSEGEPVSAHYSEKYTIDTLNAIAFMKDHEMVDKDRIGYWGHSNGGEIGLRVIVISSDVKTASFWAGVVGSYEDMFETYLNDIPFLQNDRNPLVSEFGLPSQNAEFWSRIDPYDHLEFVSAPVQLQHGMADKSVPVELSLSLKRALEASGKKVEYFEYPGDDHNIEQNSSLAWRRTIQFFEDNL